MKTRSLPYFLIGSALLLVSGILLLNTGCTKTATKEAEPPTKPSVTKAVVNDGGPLVLTTSTAEFQVLPSGYVQGFLLKDGKKLTLDETLTGQPGGSDYVIANGKEVQFVLDFGQAQVLEAVGKMGAGKRVEIPARPLGPSGTTLQRTLTVEAYDDFPNLLLTSLEYKNDGPAEVTLDQAVTQRHRFDAALAQPKVAPYDMWSFHGSSYDWGKDDVEKAGGGVTFAPSCPAKAGHPVVAGA